MAEKGKKNRKYGRNKTYCTVYASSGRRERNKTAKQARHWRKCAGKFDKLLAREGVSEVEITRLTRLRQSCQSHLTKLAG